MSTATKTKKTVGGKSATATKKVTKSKAEAKPKAPESTGDMFFEIGRTDFTNAVNLVSIALPSKEFNDAKSGIMLEAKYEGDTPMLYLTANALDVFIRHGVRLNDDIEEGFVVPNGSFLTRLVKNLKAMKNPLEFYYQHSDGGEELQITCGSDYTAPNIQHYDPVGFVNPLSKAEIQKFPVISIPANVIKTALDKVAFACSKDVAIINLTAVLIEQGDDGMTIIGTDGKRFSYLYYKAKTRAPKSVMIGVKYLQTLKEVINALEIKDTATLDLYMSDDKLYMVTGNTTVGIQIYGGIHPIQEEGGYEQFVIPEAKCAVEVKLDREKFMSKLNLAIAHNNSSRDVLRMRLKGDKGIIKNTEGNSNIFETDFDMVMTAKSKLTKPIVFDFSPDLLIDGINAIGEKEFRFFIVELDDNGKTYGAGNMVLLRPAAKKDYEYIHVFSLN